MASCSEEDLSCPVCQEVFEDPVLLSCSHSFCKTCLQSWWSDKHDRKCPMCMLTSTFEPAGNLVLKNLCEAFRQRRADPGPDPGPQNLCALHSDTLRLFCLDHEEPVCLVCRDSDKHRQHAFKPLDEASRLLRDRLVRSLQDLKDRLKSRSLLKDKWVQAAAHLKAQAVSVEASIQEHFKKLHLLLTEEEEARLGALREEEELKSLLVKQQVEALSLDTADLARTLQSTEEALKAPDISFLLGYKDTVERVQRSPLPDPPRLPPGALIDEAKHLGNLAFHVWSKMEPPAAAVVLDPNTAASDLLLQAGLSALRCGDPQSLPDNPERLKQSAVLGRHAFASGRRCWDVEVGDNSLWELGVLEDSARRNGDLYSGIWRMGFYHDEYKTSGPALQFTELTVQGRLRTVRVTLDLDRGRLSFSDPHTNTHLHTFTHSFRDEVFPFFSTVDEVPLTILPVKVSVALGQTP